MINNIKIDEKININKDESFEYIIEYSIENTRHLNYDENQYYEHILLTFNKYCKNLNKKKNIFYTYLLLKNKNISNDLAHFINNFLEPIIDNNVLLFNIRSTRNDNGYTSIFHFIFVLWIIIIHICFHTTILYVFIIFL